MSAIFQFEQGRLRIEMGCLRITGSEVLQMEFNLACLALQSRGLAADIDAAVIPVATGWLVMTDISHDGGRSYQMITVDRATDEEIDFGLIMEKVLNLLTPIDLVPGVMSRLNEYDRRARQEYENPAVLVDRLLSEIDHNPS